MKFLRILCLDPWEMSPPHESKQPQVFTRDRIQKQVDHLLGWGPGPSCIKDDDLSPQMGNTTYLAGTPAERNALKH